MSKVSFSGPLYVGGAAVTGAGPILTKGNHYYVDPVNGSDGFEGTSIDRAFNTLSRAYAACENNHGDVVHILAGGTSAEGVSGGTACALTAQLVWAKNFTHLVGECSPTAVSQRARITQASTATGLSPLVNITGSGCIFSNVMFYQGVADATSLVDVQVTGQRNVFHNVHFAGINHATMDAAGAASLKIDGGAENVFEDCVIGSDTTSAGANSVELWFDTAATRNLFKRCMIQRYISNAGHALVKVEDGTAIDRWQRFVDCLFYTDSVNQGVTLTSVFSIPAGIVQGKILIEGNSRMITDGASGAGDWDSNNRGLVWSASVAPTAAAAGGIMTKQ